jgi:hypothetical protein
MLKGGQLCISKAHVSRIAGYSKTEAIAIAAMDVDT